MAETVFVQQGDSIDYTPSADIVAGDVVVQGDLVGIAKCDIPAGTLGALAVVGLFDFPKAAGAGTDFLPGEAGYWDTGNQQAITDNGGGARPFLGKAAQSAVDDDETVRLRLSPDIDPPSNPQSSSSGT